MLSTLFRVSCFQIEILTPKEYIGSLMELGQDRRGVFKEMNYITENRASIIYELPLAEVYFTIISGHYCNSHYEHIYEGYQPY